MKMKKYSLKYKLSASYAVMALLLVASISLISNFFLRSQFEQYMIRQQETKNKEIATQIAQQMLHTASGQRREQALETVGVSALERGVIVKIYDPSGATLWDATVHNGGFCQQMLANMAAEMQSRSPNFKGGYEEKSYPLLAGAQNVGTVAVGYYGPFYYSSNDAEFITTLNRVLMGVGLGSLLVAVFLGIYMASRISNPIARATGAAENIAKGNYNNKISAGSNTLELDRLTTSINSLSEELQNQEVLRRRLTTDIAHELRTPLAALQGNLEALIDGIWEPDKERFESCHEEILRLNRLVSDLERLAQLEDENSVLQISDVNLREQADRAVRNFEADIMKKEIRMTVFGENIEVQADADKISRLFMNLISNALKYTPEKGSVTVNLTRKGQSAVIEVSDTGTGIAQEDLPYIFERFYRTDRSRSSRSGGAGIGLTIVKAIVEMHHGSISAQSELGKGSVFQVVLPLHKPKTGQ